MLELEINWSRKWKDKAFMTAIHLFTDGSCLGNPGPGGWAALLRYGDHEKMLSGSLNPTTNNQMELQAVISGLAAITRPCQVTIVTDSQYVMNGFTKGWLEKWRKNDWKTAAKKPVKNKELWQQLWDLTQTHEITWEWVKGHAGHPENERVDEEAQKQARSAG